jgi:tRNA A-37 threonylcarbamoyl transferase component Bud32/tetratricopeptide (TPR) repeat protein
VSAYLDRLKAALADRYAVEIEVGSGGMATVYLAEDLKHHRRVAVKVLRPELAAALGTERFLREIEIAAGLAHPNILPLHDSGEADGLLFYVMPYVEGESLRERLNREGQLPLPEATQITREIADALSYAHGRGVIHRDIKPENVLLQAGHAVVTDFGIARAVSEAGGEKLTETGLAVGTPSYMSPEQASGERRIDARTDVYSLGCVLYEMLAGEPPFTGPTPQAIVARSLTETPRPLRVVREAIPAGVERTAGKALARSAADRYQTADEFASALNASESGEHPTRERRRMPWLAMGIGAAAVVAVLAVGAKAFLGRESTSVVPSASRIAVIPPSPASPDTALARIGRDLVITLSAAMEGIGDIRMVSAQTILAQLEDPSATYTLDQAAALARQLDASSLLHGGILRAGDDVRVEMGLYTSDSLAAVARVAAAGQPDDLLALTDSLTWALLSQVWTAREPPTPSLAAVTTRSLPALRAFLDGERAFADGRWLDAAAAYSRAWRADSTFWLASMLYSFVATAWTLPGFPVDTVVARAYTAHLSKLPDPQRSWFEEARPWFGLEFPPGQTPTWEDHLTAYGQLAARFPDYWPIWFDYADELMHWGPFFGHPLAEARSAWQRTLALNPRLVNGWQHLFVISIGHDTGATARALDEMQRLSSRTDSTATLPLLDRLLHQYAMRGPDPALIDRVAERYATALNPWDHERLLNQTFNLGFPQAQIDISRRVLRLGPGADAAAWHRLGIALAWAARGAWDSALVALERYVQRAPGDSAALGAYRLAAVGAWLGAVQPGAAERWQPEATAVAQAGRDVHRAELAWLDGILAVARRDTAALRSARERIVASRDAERFLVRSLAALELGLAGERARAADTLVTLEWDVAFEGFEGSWVETLRLYAFAHVVNRLTAGRWLLEEGDTTGAAKLLMWHETFLPIGARAANRANNVVAGLAYLERARIEEVLGRSELARDYYEQFLRRYDTPVEAHRHLVEEAGAALARLSGFAESEP